MTTFSQTASASTAALCSVMLDCIKVINDLLKKDGSATVSAISH